MLGGGCDLVIRRKAFSQTTNKGVKMSKKDVRITPRALDSAEGCIDLLRNWQSFVCWEARDKIKDSGVTPTILDFVDSIIKLYNDDSLSLARIGDGEFGLVTGVTVPNNGCQVADASLQEALLRVLRCDNPKCRVAIPKAFFYDDPSCVSDEIARFVPDCFFPRLDAGDYMKYVLPDYTYLDGSMSVVCKHYPTVGRLVHLAYYYLLKRMLTDRDVIVVTGDLRFEEYEHSLLDDAGTRSVSLLSLKQKNVWEDYANIKQRLLDINRSGSRLVLLGCGPTATVLAYELADKMRCLDVGHVFGDYNLALGGAGIGAFWA